MAKKNIPQKVLNNDISKEDVDKKIKAKKFLTISTVILSVGLPISLFFYYFYFFIV